MGFLFRRVPPAPPVERLLEAHGAARCAIAVTVMQRLCAMPNDIPSVWERIELPLVQDLPDCPPSTKQQLIAALEDCSAACRHRDTARRIMIVRDSLRQ